MNYSLKLLNEFILKVGGNFGVSFFSTLIGGNFAATIFPNSFSFEETIVAGLFTACVYTGMYVSKEAKRYNGRKKHA